VRCTFLAQIDSRKEEIPKRTINATFSSTSSFFVIPFSSALRLPAFLLPIVPPERKYSVRNVCCSGVPFSCFFRNRCLTCSCAGHSFRSSLPCTTLFPFHSAKPARHTLNVFCSSDMQLRSIFSSFSLAAWLWSVVAVANLAEPWTSSLTGSAAACSVSCTETNRAYN
jgi:hypothetical protein